MNTKILRKATICLLLCILFPSSGKAQYILVQFKDGTTKRIEWTNDLDIDMNNENDIVIKQNSQRMLELKRSDVSGIGYFPGKYTKPGDVNKDDNVDISDVTSIINLIAGKEGTQDQTPDDKPDPLGLCPDSNHPHAIDLGTYGTWSCCNVGAKTPIDTGGFYAWAETEEKGRYSQETYQYYNPEEGWKFLTKDLSGTEYDVAHVKWGGDWCMPTSSQYEKLLRLTHESVTIKGVSGVKFTYTPSSDQKRYLFLPLPGNKINGELISNFPHIGFQSFYFTSNADSGDTERAKVFLCDDGYYTIDWSARWYGAPVRPVIKK
jgi:hypothetical protein